MKDRLNAIKVRQWFRPCQGSARDQGALVDDIMEKAVGAHSQPGGPIAFISRSWCVCSQTGMWVRNVRKCWTHSFDGVSQSLIISIAVPLRRFGSSEEITLSNPQLSPCMTCV